MSKSLVIVESPAKAKTINKYLGADYAVEASMGHVMDLPKKGLGVSIEEDFAPTLEEIPSKKPIIKKLRAAASKAKDVYLAADPDREGEAICAHLRELLDGKRRKFFRVMFNEITRDAVREAFEHPGDIDERLVDAQQARRILDRLVGYQVSPLLWKKVRRGLSAGRVQTVALRLIVERERDIQSFKKQEYWTITAHLRGENPPPFDARLLKFKGRELGIPRQEIWESGGKREWRFVDDGKDFRIPDQESAEEHVARVKGEAFIVRSVTTKEKRRFPVPPFTTSKLQQEAVRKLHFSAKKTMMLAQKLYEGVEISEEGAVGLVTYMRTDSTRVAEGALSAARAYVLSAFGETYLPAEAIRYKSKRGAQDAHEAIRPTNVTRTPDSVRAYLNPDEFKLYKLIWQRFVASQMNPAIYEVTTVDIGAGDYVYRATGSVLKFNGFLAVYEEGKDEKTDLEEDEDLKYQLPILKVGEDLRLHKLFPEQHFTEPPPRYNEATLVKALEEKGIGRPSTYATILSVIQNREYVNKALGRFFPTELGMLVCELLVKSFSDIFDVAYTARMEEELDEVEDGKLAWTDALDEFYKKFKKDLRLAERNMEDIKGEGIATDEKCEKCGKPMVIRLGRRGQFLACTGYPECDGTRDLPPELAAKYGSTGPAAPEVPEQACEKCGKPMTVRRGRFGYFLACTGYPECRNTRKIIVKDGQATVAPPAPEVPEQACEKCGKPMTVKRGRFGYFLACTGYPECRNTRKIIMKDGQATVAPPAPKVPDQTCEKCGKPMTVKAGRFGYFLACTGYPKCRNKKKIVTMEGQPAAVSE